MVVVDTGRGFNVMPFVPDVIEVPPLVVAIFEPIIPVPELPHYAFVKYMDSPQ